MELSTLPISPLVDEAHIFHHSRSNQSQNNGILTGSLGIWGSRVRLLTGRQDINDKTLSCVKVSSSLETTEYHAHGRS
jgi:hypothetical protein